MFRNRDRPGTASGSSISITPSLTVMVSSHGGEPVGGVWREVNADFCRGRVDARLAHRALGRVSSERVAFSIQRDGDGDLTPVSPRDEKRLRLANKHSTPSCGD